MSGALQSSLDALEHFQAGRMVEAEAQYREALACEPNFTPIRKRALHCVGLLLMARGKPAQAADCWREIAVSAPFDLASLINLAKALCAAGQLDESLAVCDQALAVDAHCVEAFLARNHALIAAGRTQDAVTYCRMEIAMRPDGAPAHAALAFALLHAKDPAGAVLAADIAVNLDPELAEAWFARGTASAALKSWEVALSSLKKAIDYAPLHAAAQLNLGNTMAALDRRNEAETWLQRAIALDPSLAEAHASLGHLLSGGDKLDEAARSCEAAIGIRPDFAEAHFNLAVTHLLAGDFERGWKEFEWRKRHPLFSHTFPLLPGPQWDGRDLSGKTLLVRAEQGMGDTIQVARFLPQLADAGWMSCSPVRHRWCHCSRRSHGSSIDHCHALVMTPGST